MRNLKWSILLLTLICVLSQTKAQEYDPIVNVIHLDSFVVTATRSGFEVADFVEMVQEDESFYQAFRNLRFLSYQSDNEINIYHKKGKQLAKYEAKIQQNEAKGCRKTKILEEEVSGNYFKKKRRLRYYTADLFDRLFFAHKEICEFETEEVELPKGMEKHIQELKKLIFQTGEEADVPFIGKKTAIFEEDMIPYYTYSIESKQYAGNIDCYVFSAKAKPEFKADKTVIKSLETYFDKENFQVVARNYQLKYEGFAFDFDVTMNIRLRKLGKTYVPTFLSYDGSWKVATQKPEIAKFSASFYDFE
ncbi:MAG: hypothetical protein AAGG68_19800 [Bacteroidota bacterium]